MLPPDFRGNKNSNNAAMLMLDSTAFGKIATKPKAFYNYDDFKEGCEEPYITEKVAWDRAKVQRESPGQGKDFRRKTHFELQSAKATLQTDSSYVPGGAARAKAELGQRIDKRKGGYGRRVYAEQFGAPTKCMGWDSIMTRKFDLSIHLPEDVERRIQEKAWRQVEQMFNPLAKKRHHLCEPASLGGAEGGGVPALDERRAREIQKVADQRLREHISATLGHSGTMFPPLR